MLYEGYRGPEIGVSLWQQRDDDWRRQQKYVIRSQDDWAQMPIAKNWSTATVSHIKTNTPTKGSVYELKSFGELVYIGQAGNLQRRLLEHLNDREPNYYWYKRAHGLFTTPEKLETKHLNQYEAKHGRLPRWNQRDTR